MKITSNFLLSSPQKYSILFKIPNTCSYFITCTKETYEKAHISSTLSSYCYRRNAPPRGSFVLLPQPSASGDILAAASWWASHDHLPLAPSPWSTPPPRSLPLAGVKPPEALFPGSSVLFPL